MITRNNGTHRRARGERRDNRGMKTALMALVLFLALAVPVGMVYSAGPTFIVDSTGDGADSSPGDGVCDDGTGKCTLRAAIEESNASSTTSTIGFNIPTSDPGYQATTTSFSIRPTSSLPTITSSVVIDGYTQPGAAVNTDPVGFNGTLKIVLDGSQAGTSTVGLRITGGDSTVRGLVINRFDGAGIAISTGGGNLINGNFIGVNVAGEIAMPNRDFGLDVSGNDHVVGGPKSVDRNVISGNGRDGIGLHGGATGNQIVGNLIGVDVTGSATVPNGLIGIYVHPGYTNTIQGNVISANGFGGIAFAGGSANNRVFGNFIGTDLSGELDLGNSNYGVRFDRGSTNNQIGGSGAGQGNVIAFTKAAVESGAGVLVKGADVYPAAGTGNSVLSNSIFSNAALGIDVGASGVTTNDSGDVDSGPNNLQNFPVITSALIEKGDLIADYSIDSVVGSSTYPLLVQFFIADADGQEGKTFLSSDTYATSTAQSAKVANLGNGFALGVKAGDVIVATATDANGNTSEFSLATTATTVTSVPILAPWALVVVAVLLAGVVGWRRRLTMREPR